MGNSESGNEVGAVTDIKQGEPDLPTVDIGSRIFSALARQAARDGLNLQLLEIRKLAASVTKEIQLQKYWGVIDSHEESLLGVYANVADAVQGVGQAREEGWEALELRTNYATAFEPLSAEDAALAEAAAR